MTFKKIIALLFFISLSLWMISGFYKNRLPDPQDVLPQVYTRPVLAPTTKTDFSINKAGFTYNVHPQGQYELYGLIVSRHDASSWGDLYHEQSKDYINIKDICVVFDQDVKSDIYKRIKFSSGSWTCYYNYDNTADGEAFKPDSMSNNHLVTIDPEIARRVLDTARGDQIHLKGYWCKYGQPGQPMRGYNTFTLGKGECQVIYLTDFEILNQNPWKFFRTFFKSLTLLFGLFWLIKYYIIEKIIL